MADSTIPNLTAVTTPVSTDLFRVRQAADTRDKKMTRVQVHTLQVGESFAVPVDNRVGAAGIVFGVNSNIYCPTEDTIRVALDGVVKWDFISNRIEGNVGNAPAILNESATATNPNIVSSRADVDTGQGWISDDLGCLIAGGVNVLQFGETGSAPTLGFFGTTAVVKPSGVAVTDVAIHAALVTLGLIAA